MTAGPYPTKALFLALKTRVETLESTPGGGGLPGGFAPVYGLTQGENTGHSLYGAETIVQASAIVMATDLATSRPITVPAFLLPLSLTIDDIAYVAIKRGAEDRGGAQIRTVTQIEGSTVVDLDPTVLAPGDALAVVFNGLRSVPTKASRYGLSGSNGYRTAYLDASETEVPALIDALLFSWNRETFGMMAPESMNVVRAPSTLNNGDFEIVSTVGSVPRMRFCNFDGQIYTLSMTLET